jgi:hypothetical protein
MSKLSDPARDFTDLCLKIRNAPANVGGAESLAAQFIVAAWSTDFMLILASIHQRIEALRIMIEETDLDDDIKATARGCLERVRHAFSMVGLANPWQHAIDNFLTDNNLTPIRMASGYVRVNHGYYIPDENELSELSGDIESLIDWLSKINIHEKDFIRSSLIDGLQGFLFRINRVGFFGWPDSFESLKAVVSAYMALERGMPDPNVSPPYEAMVKKVSDFLRKTFERVKFAKDVSETGDWLLRGYGALQAIGHLQPSIAGLLTHAG